jgi:hypothetical protein
MIRMFPCFKAEFPWNTNSNCKFSPSELAMIKTLVMYPTNERGYTPSVNVKLSFALSI